MFWLLARRLPMLELKLRDKEPGSLFLGFNRGSRQSWRSLLPVYWRKKQPPQINVASYVKNDQARRPPAARRNDRTWRDGVGRLSRGISPAGQQTLMRRLESRVLRASSPSDPMFLPTVSVYHPRCMHDHANTACHYKKRRTIGGRCRKWCISAQSASGKRKCAACNLCRIRFNHRDARLQKSEATVHTLWMHEWNSFGLRTGQHFGPRYASNVISLQCKMPHAEQPRSKNSDVCAKSPHFHVQVKKDDSRQQPETHHQSQSQSRLFKRSRIFLSEVAEETPATLRKMPRLSEPGPLGMRGEHWCGFLAENSDLFVQVVAHTHSVFKISGLD